MKFYNHLSILHHLIYRRSIYIIFFFFSSRRRHTRLQGDWSSDVCSSDLLRLRSARGHGERGGERPSACSEADQHECHARERCAAAEEHEQLEAVAVVGGGAPLGAEGWDNEGGQRPRRILDREVPVGHLPRDDQLPVPLVERRVDDL